jgi:hypothetical protein
MLSDDPIVAVNRSRRVAIAEDGSECPITDFLDCCGEETDDGEEAVAAICKLPNGSWAAIDLSRFGDEVRH